MAQTLKLTALSITAVALSMSMVSQAARAQAWPNKPIRLVVP